MSPHTGDRIMTARRMRLLGLGIAAAMAIVALAYSPFSSHSTAPPPRQALALTVPLFGAAAAAASLQNADYVGSDACKSCHAAEHAAWAKSHHALAMQHATDKTVLGDFNDARFAYGDITSSLFRRDEKFMVRTDGPDGALKDYDVRFTFGVAPLQQYLVDFGGGRLQALPIAWDTRPKEQGGQRWFHLYPDQRITYADPLHWTGLQQNWNFICAECHSTNLQRNFDAKTNSYATSFSEINVACESCHGPGSRHLTWAERAPDFEAIAGNGLTNLLKERRDVTWIPDAKTGNSQRSLPRSTTVEIETCAFCHSRRGPIWSKARPGAPIGDHHHVVLLDESLYFPDGQIREEVYEYGSFMQSRMFHEGVTCSDCHEPHSLKLRAEGNGVCLQCHAAEKFDGASHTHHIAGSAGARCASCHMPERSYMVVDPRRDHSLRIPRPDLSVSLGVPNACTNCHSDKPPQWAADQLAQWFGPSHEGFQNFAELFRDGSDRAPGVRKKLVAYLSEIENSAIARASSISRLDRIDSSATLNAVRKALTDTDPLVRRAAANAYSSAPPAARLDLAAVLDDPVRDVRLEAARLLAPVPAESFSPEGRSKRDTAIEEYIASLRSNADRPEAHHNLAVLLLSLRRTAEAEAALKLALNLDPAFTPGSVTLADLYRASGRDAEGEEILRATIVRQPNIAAGHHALGLWLVRNRRTREALEELEQAALLAPEDARFGYVYAIAVAEHDRAGALDILQGVLARHPYDRDTLYALATMERDAGKIDAARHYAETLATLEPNDLSLVNLLRQLQQ